MSQMKQAFLPEEFQRAFEQTEAARIHERLNLTYVALTRARQALFIIVQSKTTANSTKAAGLVMAGLQIDPKRSEGALLWESGDPLWHQTTNSVAAASKDDTRPIKHVLESIQFKPSDETRFLSWQSPSAPTDRRKILVQDVLDSKRDPNALLHGVLIHRCLEQVQWLDDVLPNPVELREMLMSVEGATKQRISRAIAFFEKIVRKPKLQTLLRRDHYQSNLLVSFDGLQVFTERPFTVRLSEGVLTGVIDRLVLMIREGQVVGADVVDYKTDHPTAADWDDRVNAYRPQLLRYRDAVAAIYRLEQSAVTARIFFAAMDRQTQLA